MTPDKSRPRPVTVHRPRTNLNDKLVASKTMLRSSLAEDLSLCSLTLSTPPSTPQSRTKEHPATLEALASPLNTHAGNLLLKDKGKSPLPSVTKELTPAATTTRTRERLRHLEEEHDQLRRAMDEERAKASAMWRRAEENHDLVERLKREGDSAALSVIEAERRMSELRRDERLASAEAPRRSMAGLFKAVCSTDLLFLIDTTSSMGAYIEAAKQQVRSIVNDIGTAFLNEAEVRMAIVGYKDHRDSPNIQFLDFTTSADQVRAFLNGMHATGGADVPEDVLGGIKQALNASWKHQTRCIIHIADAPPHGRVLHDLGGSSDSYSTPGSEPHGLRHEMLLSQIVGMHINYALLRINSSTDRMAYIFSQAYAAASADCTLLKTNKYYSQATSISRRSTISGFLFQEAELGISFSALRHLVYYIILQTGYNITNKELSWRTAGMTILWEFRTIRTEYGSRLFIREGTYPFFLGGG